MKIVAKGEESKTIKFKDLDEGECFTEGDSTQVQIKTDEGSGCCLRRGVLTAIDDDDKVIRVDCELRIL